MATVERLLLRTAFHHAINEPNIEAGFERFVAVTGPSIDFRDFCDAVDACLHNGLIRDPVRLPAGALQCHWHLELTAAGVAAVRLLPDHPA
jgi:hypothetical protein